MNQIQSHATVPPTGAELVSVVLPAHNEAASLPVVVAAIAESLRSWPHEIVIVDDGSTDATWTVIGALRESHPSLRGLRLTRNFGHQAALLAGLREARGAAVVMMDSDGQHPAVLLPLMIERWARGVDVVQGVRRRNEQAGILRSLASRWYYALLRLLSGLPIVPGTADFRLLSRRVVDLLVRSEGPPPFFRAFLPWVGFPTEYLPFDAGTRIAGRTSYGWRRMFGLSLEGIVGYSAVPLRLAGLVGGLLAIMSFLYLAYVVTARVSGARVVPGWASVAGLVALLSGIQLMVLAVIGEYLARVFTSTLHRPSFVVLSRLDD